MCKTWGLIRQVPTPSLVFSPKLQACPTDAFCLPQLHLDGQGAASPQQSQTELLKFISTTFPISAQFSHQWTPDYVPFLLRVLPHREVTPSGSSEAGKTMKGAAWLSPTEASPGACLVLHLRGHPTLASHSAEHHSPETGLRSWRSQGSEQRGDWQPHYHIAGQCSQGSTGLFSNPAPAELGREKNKGHSMQTANSTGRGKRFVPTAPGATLM
ncbi:uncharacterized protein LOC111186227 [Delphinapterus leucas]|uniref:Uncharacterized protein LOC111186227 n=1 Tax=Delphinapterus leucas TaxID=9749 RepID=A0A2Y9Q3K8_DELLE|nr:uncharacterized protein LOC111186227 [Delphinapterus leucas]